MLACCRFRWEQEPGSLTLRSALEHSTVHLLESLTGCSRRRPAADSDFSEPSPLAPPHLGMWKWKFWAEPSLPVQRFFLGEKCVADIAGSRQEAGYCWLKMKVGQELHIVVLHPPLPLVPVLSTLPGI